MSNSDEMSVLAEEPFSSSVATFAALINNCDALTFLIGAGCSKCAGLPLTKELTSLILTNPDLDSVSKEILNAIEAIFSDAADSHIEDYLSEIVDLLAITDRRSERGVKTNTVVVGSAAYDATQLRNSINQIKQAIAMAISKRVDIATHRNFVASIHRPLRVGRPTSPQPVDYLVLNYDTIMEDSLASEGIPYSDGLFGGSTAWWQPETFETEGLSARVLKLHGSIDWRLFEDETAPRRIGPSVETSDKSDLPVLIWPSSTKYQETQSDPFAQLLERARQAMRPAANSQRLLTICGYSFGDSHINSEVDKALRESEGRLTVAAFTNEDGLKGQLKEWGEDPLVAEQVLVFANRGFFHGATRLTSKQDLPWWKFEYMTRMLQGEA